MSLHKKDWLKLLGGAALLATGAGAAGIGPLAGMLAGETAVVPLAADAAATTLAADAGATALAGEGALGAGATEGLLATGATEAALPTAGELAAADIAANASTELGAGSFSGAQGGLDLSGLLKSGATAGAKGAAGAAGAQGAAHLMTPAAPPKAPSPINFTPPPPLAMPQSGAGMTYQQQMRQLGFI